MRSDEKTILESDEFGGTYCTVVNPEGREWLEIPFCRFSGNVRFCASHLNDPFFPCAGAFSAASEIPEETQWLAVKHGEGDFSLIIPLACDGCRTCLFGGEGDTLMLSCEFGDKSAVREKFRAVYTIRGGSIAEISDTAAKSLGKSLGLPLISEKKTPKIADLFGWCTWNAFYHDVSAEKMECELEVFKNAGFVPPFILLDDGWQSVSEAGTGRGHHQLSSLAPNEKFGGDLTPLVKKLKKEYGVEMFYVWHAVGGYWGGVAPFSKEMEKYSSKIGGAAVARGMLRKNPKRSHSECFAFGLIDDFEGFYDDYHKSLAAQGVDGVKVDVQSIISSHGRGNGGREKITRKMRSALEKSVNKNFGGELISCMSCTNDILFSIFGTNLMRSSDDFFPEIPTSHFQHVYNNAVNSVFMGKFTVCDWDMFHSVHEYAEFHAMARAISGGPVYVSDKHGEHDFDIFRRLTICGGRVLRCQSVARISEKSMFVDFEREDIPLYIDNENKYGSVMGVFNPRTDKEVATEVEKRMGYALYSFSGDTALLDSEYSATLAARGCDIYTVMPIENGFCTFGLADKYNGAAAILDLQISDSEVKITLADGGRVAIYSASEVICAFANGQKIPLSGKGFMTLDTKTVGKTELIIKRS